MQTYRDYAAEDIPYNPGGTPACLTRCPSRSSSAARWRPTVTEATRRAPPLSVSGRIRNPRQRECDRGLRGLRPATAFASATEQPRAAARHRRDRRQGLPHHMGAAVHPLLFRAPRQSGFPGSGAGVLDAHRHVDWLYEKVLAGPPPPTPARTAERSSVAPSPDPPCRSKACRRARPRPRRSRPHPPPWPGSRALSGASTPPSTSIIW